MATVTTLRPRESTARVYRAHPSPLLPQPAQPLRRTHHEILVVGVTHRSAPVEVREKLAFSAAALDDALHRLVSLAPIEEAAILSTCNRVEVIAATADGDAALEALARFLADRWHAGRERVREHLLVYRGREAVRHLFRVAASLDSMVVGEAQVLGQLKDAYARAAAAGSAGTVLHRCFHRSFSAAKRVRTRTGIAGGAVSVGSAAVELACKIFERLTDKTVMLIGAGTMSELAARHLLAHGVGNMIVANRTYERAVELAREFHGMPVQFDDFPRHLQMADVLIGSTGADHYVLTRSILADAVRERKNRPMFLIDMSVPRSFEPSINDMDNVFLYDIDDLAGVAEVNRAERCQETETAEAIVDGAVDAFCDWLSALDAVPTIVALREKVEAIRKAELERTLATLRELSPHERQSLEAMTAAITNKILHGPVTYLRQHDRQQDSSCLTAARQLFDIGEPEEC